MAEGKGNGIVEAALQQQLGNKNYIGQGEVTQDTAWQAWTWILP